MKNKDKFIDNRNDKNEENSKIIKLNNNEIKDIDILRNQKENNFEEIELKKSKKIITLNESKSKKMNSY